MGAIDGSQRLKEIQREYQESKKQWEEKEDKLKKRFILNAWLRLIAFTSAFALPFTFLSHWSYEFFACFIACFSCFLWLVWRANNIAYKRAYISHRIKLLTKELNYSTQNWLSETDGSEFIEPDHDYAHDLDLFGKGSLFQFINRTSTVGGLKQLAHKLKSISLFKSDILSKQKAIKELAEQNEFRQHFYALGALVAAANKKNRKIDLNKQPALNFISKSSQIAMAVFWIALLTTITLISFGIINSIAIVYLFFIGLGIVGARLKNINKVHNEVASLGNYLQRYAKMIRHIEDSDLHANYLLTLKSKLQSDGKTASEVTAQLAGLIKQFDQRLNMLLGVILNGFFLWDLLICIRLKAWYNKYGRQLQKWIDTLHEFEALNSLATFSYNHPHYVYPQTSDKIIFEANELGHPLIPGEERVSNNFSFSDQQRICVVTGANMAGKSTFLRTVGVALVLAGNGCAVAAKSFQYKPLPFITNMRAIDNLLKHESYFFAELSRLQMILERLKEKGELFFILDEILKGTNSLDKYQGSMALIKQLLKHNGCGLVATHDLELGELAKQTDGQVFNNCFEVSFNDEGLSFDYKLRTGVTESHNATYLMEQMGLIPSENVRL
ncbi:MutS-related protein [Carboxylicivirga sp. RSCT41]|uniref:MutS-related protein n=1 Tax=Carboxylicivirga agarovorans TaxID=3417570 RepID=UPI003D327373